MGRPRRARIGRWPPLWTPLVALGYAGSAEAFAGDVPPDDPVSSVTSSDFVDTRLTLTFGDDDLFSSEGERLPVSPGPGFGDRPGYQLFFDNLNTRFTGRENITHLVLHRRAPAFADHVTTEAAVVARIDFDGSATGGGDTSRAGASGFIFNDTGSYLRLRYEPWSDHPDDGIALVLFPLDSERFRLGHLFDLSYQGAEFVPQTRLVRAPGAKIEFRRRFFHAFVGLKTLPATTSVRIQPDEDLTEPAPLVVDQTQYAALAGAGLQLWGDRVQVDVGGGLFQQGELQLAGYPQERLHTAVGSARVVLRQHLRVVESIDLQLYENDPNEPVRRFVPPDYVPGQWGWLVALEGLALSARVADIDQTGDLDYEPSVGVAARARLQWSYLRFELTAMARDFAFILRTRPDFLPFSSLPNGADVDRELFVALAGDYHFPGPRLTVGGSIGLQRPASLTLQTTLDGIPADRAVVLRDQGPSSVLAEGEGTDLIVASRVYARMEISEILYALVWVQHVMDANTAPLRIEAGAESRLQRPDADRVGLGVAAAARF